MSDGIFIDRGDGVLETLREQPYLDEADLQRLLERHPSLMPGDQIDADSPRRWLLVRREAPISLGSEDGPSGWLDHLFLDQDAVPTLVEVKRSSDTRIRREVVGQMLDYAANAVAHWRVEEIRALFERTCEESGQTSAGKLAEFLGSDQDEQSFWGAAKTNLQAGRIRLLFIADVIPPELRRIIEYLNRQMDPTEVLGIEVRQFVGSSLRTLVPRLIGQTSQTDQKANANRPSRQWDERSFFADMEKNPPDERQVARKLLDWANTNGLRVWWGRGATMGSFVPTLDLNGVKHQAFAVYSGTKDTGVVEIYFQWYAGKPPFDDEMKRRRMLAKLNQIPGVTLPEDSVSRRPSIPLRTLASEESLNQFLKVMEWYLAEVRAA